MNVGPLKPDSRRNQQQVADIGATVATDAAQAQIAIGMSSDYQPGTAHRDSAGREITGHEHVGEAEVDADLVQRQRRRFRVA